MKQQLSQLFAVTLVAAALALVLIAPSPDGMPPFLSIARAADNKPPTTAELQKQIADLQNRVKLAEERVEFFKSLAENQKAQLAAQGAQYSVAASADTFKNAHNELAKSLGCPEKGLVMDQKGEPACPPKPDPEEEKRRAKVHTDDEATRKAAEAAAAAAQVEHQHSGVSPAATNQK